MAKLAGTISGGNGHYPGYSKHLPTTTGRSFSDQPWMDTERVCPRWCGQDMSDMWDSGLGRTQRTFRLTSPQPAGRKRRVGDRLVSGPDIRMPASNEWALWGTPLKRALFGLDGQNSISSGSDVPEGEYSEVAQSSRSPQNDDSTGTRSPSVKLVDAVLQLQKDMEEIRAESGYRSAGRQASLMTGQSLIPTVLVSAMSPRPYSGPRIRTGGRMLLERVRSRRSLLPWSRRTARWWRRVYRVVHNGSRLMPGRHSPTWIRRLDYSSIIRGSWSSSVHRSRLGCCTTRLGEECAMAAAVNLQRDAGLTVQITFIFIGQTRLVFGNRVCTCVTKHSNTFRTFLNLLKNSKRVWHEAKLHISRLPLFANFDLWSVSVWWV